MTNIEQLTATINKLRNEYQGKEFSNSELRKILSDTKIPYATRISTMTEFGIFVSPVRGTYLFPSSPIYIRAVEQFYNFVKEKSSEYNKSYVIKNTPENEQRMTINEAIQVLKDSGEYTIYKKVIQWEEVK